MPFQEMHFFTHAASPGIHLQNGNNHNVIYNQESSTTNKNNANKNQLTVHFMYFTKFYEHKQRISM